MLTTTSVIPSLPASSFTELETLVEVLGEELSEIQIDIVDGQFVPLRSWPFTEDDPQVALKQLASLPSQLEIEIDCMVKDPEQYFPAFFELGIKRIVLHWDSTPKLAEAIAELKLHQCQVGLAFTNDVSLVEVTPYIPTVDYLQVMGIKEVGQQGQPFDERTTTKVHELRSFYPGLTIAVDGAVNSDTILALKEAGANRFLPGSAVVKAENPKIALQQLKAML